MTDDTLLPFDLPAVRRKKLTVDFEGGNQSSNGGALLLRESERDVGVCRRLAGAMPDRRDPDHIQHQMVEMVTARVTAIACGHEDAGERRAAGLAIDHQPAGECAKQVLVAERHANLVGLDQAAVGDGDPCR
jgi:hypothetical protein